MKEEESDIKIFPSNGQNNEVYYNIVFDFKLYAHTLLLIW